MEISEEQFIMFVANEFQVELETVSIGMEFRALTKWNSLNALLFIAAIHDNYEVLISSIELSELKTFDEILELIRKKR